MSLLNRIKKVEATMLQPASGAVLLREPAEDAGNEALDAHEAEVMEALAAGHQVVVHSTRNEKTRRIGGVIYEADEFTALATLLAHTPASDGHSRNKLSQIIADAQGTPLPVVRCPE